MEKLQKLRSRLAKQRGKIAEMEAEALQMEQAITRAEDEQLGYLARSVANTLSGGMEEIFDLLRGLRSNPNKGAAVGNANKPNAAKPLNSGNDKEGEAVDKTGETE